MRRAPVKWNRDQFTKCPFQRAHTHPPNNWPIYCINIFISRSTHPLLSELLHHAKDTSTEKDLAVKMLHINSSLLSQDWGSQFLVLPSWRYKMTFVWPSLYFSFSSPTVPMITIAIACCCFSSETWSSFLDDRMNPRLMIIKMMVVIMMSQPWPQPCQRWQH